MSSVILTQRQSQLLDDLAAAVATATVKGAEQVAAEETSDKVSSADYEAFYCNWRSVKARHVSGQRAVAHQRWEWIESMQGICTKTCDELESLLAHLAELDGQREDVVRKTTELHNQCDQMVHDQEQLSKSSEAIAERLDLFDRVADVARILDQGNAATSHPDFGAVLDQLDGSIAFLESHSDFCQAQAYLHQFEHLRNRACISIRSALQKSLEKSSSQVELQLKDRSRDSPEASTDNQVFYTRFKAAALNYKPLMALLNERVDVHETYAVTLDELEAFYAQLRVKLVSSPVTAYLQSILHQELPTHELAAVTRQASSYILDISHFERQCFEAYFDIRQPQESLRTLQEAMADIFYKALRPVVLANSSIDSLREMADCLQMDILQPNQQSSKTNELMPVLTVVFRLHKDVQEKLIFCTSSYIRQDIKLYVVGDADLNYPGLLFNEPTDSPKHTSFQEGWYPTLQRTLNILAKIYRVLEMSTFQGLAQEAVDICILSLKGASKSLATRPLPDRTHALGPLVQMMDCQLFLIKHLLILREQVAAFECDLVSNEKYFDFSNVWDAFHLRLPEGLLGILKPKMQPAQVDTKKDIEAELKGACETLITYLTAHITQPLATLNTEIGEYLASRGSDRAKLKDQPFISPERLKEVISLFLSNVRERVPFAAAHIRLYLTSSSGGAVSSGSTQSTAQIMFMPVQKRLGDTWDRLESLLEEWNLSQDEIIGLGFVRPEELRELVLSLFYGLMEAPWSEVVSVVSQVPRTESIATIAAGAIPAAPVEAPSETAQIPSGDGSPSSVNVTKAASGDSTSNAATGEAAHVAPTLAAAESEWARRALAESEQGEAAGGAAAQHFDISEDNDDILWK